jgi:UDP-N-acetylmuramoylalanine--D-glutamate ligase
VDIAKRIKTGAKVIPVSVERNLDNGISAVGGTLIQRDHGREIGRLDLKTLPALKGAHNWQNASMAYAAGRALGLTEAEIVKGLKSFPGLAHRMQEIARLNGIPVINDSKATNADAAAKALASFPRIYWIAGGIAKAGGIAPLKEFFPKIAKAYLIGEAAPEFAKTIGGAVPVEMSGTLDRAVADAARDAMKDGAKESVILLSPACSSFDHYPNFEVRGEAFRKAVASLPGVVMKGDVHVDQPQ